MGVERERSGLHDSTQKHTKYNITLQNRTCDDKDVINDHSVVVSLSFAMSVSLTFSWLLLLLFALLFCLFLCKALAHTLVSAVELKRTLLCDLFGVPLCLSFNISFSALSVFSLCFSSLVSLSTHIHQMTYTSQYQ